MPTTVDDVLADWETLSDADWPTLLLGNGVSVNIWNGFSYASLYEKAALTREAQAIFDGLATTNFETALEAIHHARLVLDALSGDTDGVDGLYAQVRDGLFAAVNDAHVPWGSIPSPTETLIAEHLNSRRAVFTTNYDLVPYWAHLQNVALVNIVDFFWGTGQTFDSGDVSLHSSSATPVYYCHGAIHLWQDDFGDNGKWTNADTGSLLAVRNRYTADEPRRPLFISEGTSRAKVRTIHRSPYLSFCLEALRDDERNAVIVGHSLSAQDQHIIDALDAGPRRDFAVSIYPVGDPARVIADKVRIADALKRHTVRFFDSTTHPLGDRSLNVG